MSDKFNKYLSKVNAGFVKYVEAFRKRHPTVNKFEALRISAAVYPFLGPQERARYHCKQKDLCAPGKRRKRGLKRCPSRLSCPTSSSMNHPPAGRSTSGFRPPQCSASEFRLSSSDSPRSNLIAQFPSHFSQPQSFPSCSTLSAHAPAKPPSSSLFQNDGVNNEKNLEKKSTGEAATIQIFMSKQQFRESSTNTAIHQSDSNHRSNSYEKISNANAGIIETSNSQGRVGSTSEANKNANAGVHFVKSIVNSEKLSCSSTRCGSQQQQLCSTSLSTIKELESVSKARVSLEQSCISMKESEKNIEMELITKNSGLNGFEEKNSVVRRSCDAETEIVSKFPSEASIKSSSSIKFSATHSEGESKIPDVQVDESAVSEKSSLNKITEADVGNSGAPNTVPAESKE